MTTFYVFVILLTINFQIVLENEFNDLFFIKITLSKKDSVALLGLNRSQDDIIWVDDMMFCKFEIVENTVIIKHDERVVLILESKEKIKDYGSNKMKVILTHLPYVKIGSMQKVFVTNKENLDTYYELIDDVLALKYDEKGKCEEVSVSKRIIAKDKSYWWHGNVIKMVSDDNAKLYVQNRGEIVQELANCSVIEENGFTFLTYGGGFRHRVVFCEDGFALYHFGVRQFYKEKPL